MEKFTKNFLKSINQIFYKSDGLSSIRIKISYIKKNYYFMKLGS